MDDWEDEEASSASVADEKEAPVVNGTSHQAAQQAIDQEDDHLATMTSRQLSVRNGVDPPPDSVEYTGVDAPPPSRATLSPNADRGAASGNLSSLLNRRNARRVTPPHHNPLPTTAEEQSMTVPLTQDAYLRPMTPHSFPGDGDFFHRAASMGDAITPGSELGPLTPTNNLGPFVFDGSAGRDSVLRPTATTSDTSKDVTSEA